MRLCYVRFGRKEGPFPPDEKSLNSITDTIEDGVSVYEAIERNGKYQLLLPKIDPISIGTIGMCFNVAQCISGQINRPLYEVTGDIVGMGSDGEPLLKNCRVVRRIFNSVTK